MSEQKREDQWEVRTEDRQQRVHQQLWSQVHTTPAVTTTELVAPGMGCTASAGTATQPQTNPMAYTPLSSKTEGYQQLSYCTIPICHLPQEVLSSVAFIGDLILV